MDQPVGGQNFENYIAMSQRSPLFLLLVVGTGVVGCLGARLPDDVVKCHFEETGCVAKTTNYILARHFNGIPGSHLATIDPISVAKVDIIQGPESPVNVKLQFRNLQIVGLKDARVQSVKGFSKDFDGALHEFKATVPRIEMVGEYTINGKVLILPIQGEGRSNITMTNLQATVRARGKSVVSKGSTYFQADAVKMVIEPGRLYINLENLFRGDKRLGDSTNAFLNENWQDIYKELRGSVEDTFTQVLTGIINNFFAKNKYNTLFLE